MAARLTRLALSVEGLLTVEGRVRERPPRLVSPRISASRCFVAGCHARVGSPTGDARVSAADPPLARSGAALLRAVGLLR